MVSFRPATKGEIMFVVINICKKSGYRIGYAEQESVPISSQRLLVFRKWLFQFLILQLGPVIKVEKIFVFINITHVSQVMDFDVLNNFGWRRGNFISYSITLEVDLDGLTMEIGVIKVFPHLLLLVFNYLLENGLFSKMGRVVLTSLF